MLPQPPPNAPAPPPSPEAIRSRHKWRAIWIVGIASVLILSGVFYPRYRQQQLRYRTHEAFSNLRSMSLALFEFEKAFGSYPNSETAQIVPASTESTLSLGDKTSNDYFRQLIVAEICLSETVFYAGIPGSHHPDNVFDTSAHALAKGEVGFSYLVGLSSKGNPARPLVVTPLIPGTDRFDPKPFGGMAIVMRADGCVMVLPINKRGEVYAGGKGKHILDPSDPIWEGKPPAIAWPDL